jgi:hypothetical protein
MQSDEKPQTPAQNPSQPTLLPCPFCGGKPRLLPQPDGYSIDCLNCGAKVYEVTEFEEQVALKWNRRRG